MSYSWSLTGLCLCLVGEDHCRPLPPGSLPRLPHRTLHGVSTSGCRQALPRHAAEHIQRGEEGGKLLPSHYIVWLR